MSNNQSFEPRVAIMQNIFGVIYTLIMLIALSLALFTKAQNLKLNIDEEPYFQYVMAIIFFIMAAKSFFIAARVKNLIKNGTKTQASVLEIEAVRGITIVRAKVDYNNQDIIIESRFAGEKIAQELKDYLKEHNTDIVPALIVGKNNKVRGMLTIKSSYGRLVKESLKI